MLKESTRGVQGGLCEQCVNAPDCTLLGSCQRVVFNCDEFQVHLNGVDSEPNYNPGGNPAAKRVSELARANGRLGLCSSCAGWETCAYSSAESGVWHCDEYR